MIINLRGTSGSGKSTMVRYIMDQCSSLEPVLRKTKGRKNARIVGYIGTAPRLKRQVFFVGSYENQCGGCDTITDIDYARRLIREFAKKGMHVVFEGLVMNNGYAKNRDLMRATGQRYAFAFIDTPLRTCLSRIRKRRKAKGNTKELNPDNTITMYYSNLRMMERALGDGANPVSIDHQKGGSQVWELIVNDERR